MNEFLTWLLDLVQAVDPVLRTILAGVAIMLETSVLVGLVVPGDTVVIVAATAVDSVFEGVMLGVSVVVGSILGQSIGYWLGYWLGPKLRDSWLGRKIGHKNWQRSERYLLRRGGPAIFISRFLPVLHSLVPLTVGMSRFPFRRFLAWAIPACVLWAGIYIPVVALAAGTFREVADSAHYAGYVFVGIVVVLMILAFFGKKILQRVERKHLTVDTGEIDITGTDAGVED